MISRLILHRLLNGTKTSTLSEEAISMHKDIFKSKVLLMPTLYKGEASVVLIINPGGIFLPELKKTCRLMCHSMYSPTYSVWEGHKT